MELAADFFDVGNAGATFMEMIKDGTLLPGMQQRMERAMSGERLPGHYPLGKAPVGLWQVPDSASRGALVHQDRNGITGPTATTKRRSVCIGAQHRFRRSSHWSQRLQ